MGNFYLLNKLLTRVFSFVCSFMMLLGYTPAALAAEAASGAAAASKIRTASTELVCSPSIPLTDVPATKPTLSQWSANCTTIKGKFETAVTEYEAAETAFATAKEAADLAKTNAAKTSAIMSGLTPGQEGFELAVKTANTDQLAWETANTKMVEASKAASKAGTEIHTAAANWAKQVPAAQLAAVDPEALAAIKQDVASKHTTATGEVANAAAQKSSMGGIMDTLGKVALGAALGAGAMALFGGKDGVATTPGQSSPEHGPPAPMGPEGGGNASSCQPPHTVYDPVIDGCKVVGKTDEEICNSKPEREWKNNKCVTIVTEDSCLKRENRAWVDGKCVATNVNGDPVDLGPEDPAVVDTDTDDEEIDEIEMAGGPADGTGGAGTDGSGTGGASGGAAAMSGADRGVASFQKGGGGFGAAAGRGGSAAGGRFGGGAGAEKGDGSESTVQYRPLKWRNPKDKPSLEERMKERYQ